MQVDLVYYSSKEWEMLARDAHASVFNEERPSEMNRIDGALLSHVGDLPYGYITLRELDSETVYIQYGGAFEPAKTKVFTYSIYSKMIDSLLSKYKQISTLIKNENVSMLKLAMKKGFRVIGVRMFKSEVYCELIIFRGDN